MAFPSSNSVDLSWQPIAITAVSLLICFLGYSSQYLFLRAENLDPGPLTKNELVTFNVLLACLWWTYYRACTTDPGRFLFPKPHSDEPRKDASQVINNSKGDKGKPLQLPRWCKSCAAPKPARAHHCRHCGRCIPKMDHHCPWTNNCVSYTTFPSFMRFLVWTNITLVYFHCYVLWPRQAGLWHNRNLPAYLGPSMPALVHIALLSLIGGVTTFALAVMLFSTAKSWLLNTTMIEGWEISRHEALLEKQGREGGPGCATCPHPNTGSDASDFEDEHCLEPVEFPYDLGFFENMSQGMGSGNLLRWFLPVFGSTTQMPVSSSSSTQPHDQTKPPYSWPENGFNDEYGMWPPLDPEKVRRDRLYGRGPETGPTTWEERRMEFEATQGRLSADEMREAFRKRQEADLIRQRQRIMTELEEVEDYDMLDDAVPADEGLAQMGVDTGISDGRELAGPRVVEIGEDEEDLPLAEVIRRRKARGTDGLS